MSPLGRRRRPIVRRRRVVRRTRRRIWRRTRRIIRGAFIIIAIADSTSEIKLRKSDVERIENELGKPIEDLSENEIKKAMINLNIDDEELTDDDERAIDKLADEDDSSNAGKSNFCSQCGAKIKTDSNFCSNCGKEL